MSHLLLLLWRRRRRRPMNRRTFGLLPSLLRMMTRPRSAIWLAVRRPRLGHVGRAVYLSAKPTWYRTLSIVTSHVGQVTSPLDFVPSETSCSSYSSSPHL